jgi:hypothetical protein
MLILNRHAQRGPGAVISPRLCGRSADTQEVVHSSSVAIGSGLMEGAMASPVAVALHISTVEGEHCKGAHKAVLRGHLCRRRLLATRSRALWSVVGIKAAEDEELHDFMVSLRRRKLNS